jgi:hypothetical protein
MPVQYQSCKSLDSSPLKQCQLTTLNAGRVSEDGAEGKHGHHQYSQYAGTGERKSTEQPRRKPFEYTFRVGTQETTVSIVITHGQPERLLIHPSLLSIIHQAVIAEEQYKADLEALETVRISHEANRNVR